MKKFLGTKSDFLGKEFKLNNRRLAVEDVIAEGGFSIVFLVYCEADGKHYALKRLFVNEDSKLMMCRQEIEITRKLSGHKNIAECLDACITAVGNDVNEVLILLQYYKSLIVSILDEMNERLNRRYTESEVLKIFCDVCEAVSSLHHNAVPIIHRDLKIENLLRDGKGNVRLCDFGSATFTVLNPLVDGIGAVSDELQKYTTLQYRSPEMVDLYSYQSISFKSDIWALGCLLYRLCFFTNCFGDSVMAISNGQFTVPDDCPYSDRLLKLIKYMLQTDPDDRPDIYQVSHLAFTLANKFQCPISNFNVSFDNQRSCRFVHEKK
ncbi:hypothetical protein HELRODRAFT_86821 [Helobdella robusta]|uniref:non-specific serine/threonine protein kinase n=1 Tax=Helobdella robusta TaxID=6412 RepID=T1G6H4_HELRO|nr:hypothetical protein HELRODRAFT_86821 [Helobdella robusta]ESN95344.1 hypothetical protein HELRODRAFT_86821 [Helobdella robusta]